MSEKDATEQSALLIELGEPESWIEAMRRAAQRSALDAAAKGNEELAKRWRRVARALQYASAATAPDPIAGDATTSYGEARADAEESDTQTQSQGDNAP